MPPDFPSVDRNHQISNESKALVTLRCPSTWQVDFRDGDNDFGFDIEVQVAPHGEVCHTFRAQLKGTASPSYSKDRSSLSIPLRRTTLNLYANTTEPVLLVVAVVDLAENGKAELATSMVYWEWMPEELRRLRGSALAIDKSSQDSVTVHVPLANELNPDLDVVPYLQKTIDEARAVEDLTALVRNTGKAVSGGFDGPMQMLLSIVGNNPARLLSLFSVDEGDEASPREGTPQFLVAEARSHLRAGKTSLAEDLISRLDRTQFEGSPQLMASLVSLEGRVALQRMRKVDARCRFEEAYRLNPVEKHLLAQEEMRFLEAVDRNDKEAISAVEKALSTVQTDEGLVLLVRVQVSRGEFEAASATIGRIGLPKRVFPTLVLLSGQHRWTDVKIHVDDAFAQANVSLQDSVGFHLIAARACWQQALIPSSLLPDDMEAPLPGAPGLDTVAAEAAWQHAAECLRGLKEFGWPPNVELIVPIAVASAAAIGRQHRVLPLLKEAAAERPEYLVLQENLELIAISARDNGVALEANSRQPRVHEVLVRRACLLFETKQYGECISTAMAVLSNLDAPYKQTPLALAMGAAAAVKLARTHDADQLMAALRCKVDWAEFVYFARFAQQNMERSDQAAPLTTLRDGLVEFPASRVLASNLYVNLRVDEAPAAAEVISLSRLLRQGAALTVEESLLLISAHFTLEHWQDAEAEARAAITRFGENDRFASMLAVAVEMQGKTGEAIDYLEQAISLGQRRFVTLRNYLGLCLRLGRMDSAHDTIEKLLAVESQRDDRLELLRLDALILTQKGLNDRALNVVQELGLLVNPEIEIEEGMYLNLYMATTLRSESIPEGVARAFWKRVETFSINWPESRLFRSVKIPERGLNTVDQLHDMLGGVAGESREQLRVLQERERQVLSGELPVPFVARPRFVLHYIGDCFTLWDVAKRSRPEDRQYHLTTALIDTARATERVLRDTPLLDLPALLVLHDLGLFETLFSMFPRVAVPRSTIDYISYHARGILSNPSVVDAAGTLLTAINQNVHHIDQPSNKGGPEGDEQERLLYDYVQLGGSGRWAIYSDDVITQAGITVGHGHLGHMSTVDLLTLADSQGLLTPVEVSSCLEQLASWNVGITVTSRYLIAALDGALGGSRFLTASERLTCFQTHERFAKLARALWHDQKEPKQLIEHMGVILAGMLEHPRTEDESAAAIWAFWFVRVRFFLTFNSMGWNPLCYSLLIALRRLSPCTAPRAVQTFFTVVEIVVGTEHMTRREHGEVIKQVPSNSPAI
jgi:Flp pilus assembly protein TadD